MKPVPSKKPPRPPKTTREVESPMHETLTALAAYCKTKNETALHLRRFFSKQVHSAASPTASAPTDTLFVGRAASAVTRPPASKAKKINQPIQRDPCDSKGYTHQKRMPHEVSPPNQLSHKGCVLRMKPWPPLSRIAQGYRMRGIARNLHHHPQAQLGIAGRLANRKPKRKPDGEVSSKWCTCYKDL